MATPDITKAQVAAVLQAILAVIISFGTTITSTQQTALLGLSGILATALTVGDAIIRHGRARALTPPPLALNLGPAQKTAEPTTPPAPTPTPTPIPVPPPQPIATAPFPQPVPTAVQ